jgi:hypothetical protein
MRKAWLFLLAAAIPLAFVSGLWSAPDAAVWLKDLKDLVRPAPPPPPTVKNEDLKCLSPDVCVGSQVPQAFAHAPVFVGVLRYVACEPYDKGVAIYGTGLLAGAPVRRPITSPASRSRSRTAAGSTPPSRSAAAKSSRSTEDPRR